MSTYIDIDNPLKAIIDALSRVIEDDRMILELHVYKEQIKRGRSGSVRVFVETIEDK